MTDSALTAFSGVAGIGVLFFLLWLSIWSGEWKSWWISGMPSSPFAWKITPYLLLPTSVFWFIWSLTMLIPDKEIRIPIFDFVLCIGFPSSLIFTIYIAIVQPRWWLPGWLRYLHDHHQDIIELLQDEAGQMGAKEWGWRVSTQEGLEEWVEEIRHKHGK